MGRIYTPEDETSIHDVPGIYIFARVYGKQIIPLYIGMAKKIKTRISQQLNTVKLMTGIQNSSAGKRILIIGELHTKPGQVVEYVSVI